MIGTALAPARRMLTASEAFMEIETRSISLIPIGRGSLWMASADILGSNHNSKRAVRSVCAMAGDCLTAVNRLVWKLEGEQQHG